MDQIALDYAKKSFSSKNAIAILPFFDNSVELKDPILADGMAYAFYDWLASHVDRVIPPIVTLQALDDAKISGQALTDETQIQELATTLSARFIIYGSVQRTADERLRFFVSIYDQNLKQSLTPILQFATPLNDLFFDDLRTNLKPLAKTLGLKSKDLSTDEKTPKLQAFRYYVKAMSNVRHYDENALNLAQSWFDKALKDSLFQDPNIAREAALAHFKLALLDRLNGRDPNQAWNAAQTLIRDFAPLTDKNTKPKTKLTARFLHNQQHLANAVNLYKNNRHKEAAKEASLGYAAVPEDGQMFWLNSLLKGSASAGYPAHAVCIPGL